MALISVSAGPYAISLTTPEHDKEDTTLPRISAEVRILMPTFVTD